MFDFNDLLSQMNAGKSAEDLAKEFTKSLNEAIKVQEEAKKKAEEEERAKKKAAEVEAKAKKLADAEKVAAVLNAYCKDYLPNFKNPLTAEQVVKVCDSLADLSVTMKDLGNGFAISLRNGEDFIDKAFDKFFSKYGL